MLSLERHWWADRSVITSISLKDRSTSFRFFGGWKSRTVVSLLCEASNIKRNGKLLNGDKSVNKNKSIINERH